MKYVAVLKNIIIIEILIEHVFSDCGGIVYRLKGRPNGKIVISLVFTWYAIDQLDDCCICFLGNEDPHRKGSVRQFKSSKKTAIKTATRQMTVSTPLEPWRLLRAYVAISTTQNKQLSLLRDEAADDRAATAAGHGGMNM